MGYVIYRKEEHIAKITLNRPEAMNAFNSELITELIEAFHNVEEDKDVYCVVIDAAGEKAFSVGGDIKEEIRTTGDAAFDFGRLGKQCVNSVKNCRVPVICAVHGFCLGGGMEVVLVSDLTVAADNMKIGMPTIKLGTIPGWGSTKTLADVVGKGKAKELMYTGKIIKAQEAYDLGIVQFIVPREELMGKAMELAAEIADKAPIAMKTMKECIDKGWEMSCEEAFDMETEKFAMCYDTEDKFEAMSAFLEKRDHKPYKYK
ncbi:MAG: enoyl-CoA hydratase/isomerase family protein [Firmicutes bacterium]|nr:enoyl-CoA hydratase/isomerase family protein [Bacillota bacterium]